MDITAYELFHIKRARDAVKAFTGLSSAILRYVTMIKEGTRIDLLDFFAIVPQRLTTDTSLRFSSLHCRDETIELLCRLMYLIMAPLVTQCLLAFIPFVHRVLFVASFPTFIGQALGGFGRALRCEINCWR